MHNRSGGFLYTMHNKCGNFGEGGALPPLLQGNSYVRRMYKYTVLRGLFYNPVPRRRSRRRTRAHPGSPVQGEPGSVHRLPKWKARTGGGLQKNARRTQKKRLPAKGAAFLRSSPQYFFILQQLFRCGNQPYGCRCGGKGNKLAGKHSFCAHGSFLSAPAALSEKL